MIDIHNFHAAKSFAGVLGVVIPLTVDVEIIHCYTSSTCFVGVDKSSLDKFIEFSSDVTLTLSSGIFLAASLPIIYYSGRIAYSEMLLINNGYDSMV